MSTFFTHSERLYEIQEFSSVDEPYFFYELWDLSADGGLVGRIGIPDAESDGMLTLELTDRQIELKLLLRWIKCIPDADALINE